MSLVGTRPILPDELEQYELHHRARIAIKPGITGMWQVSGRSDITDFEEIVRLDTEYISEWNIGLDDLIDNFEDIEKLRQSKYMSSSMGNIYKRVKAELVSGRLVGFCGSPCQVAGLYSFLGKEYDNLFTMDFICRGMNSPKAWEQKAGNESLSKALKYGFYYEAIFLEYAVIEDRLASVLKYAGILYIDKNHIGVRPHKAETV